MIYRSIYNFTDDRSMEDAMQVTVSPKYQIAIPKEIREQFGIKAGMQLELMVWNGTLRLVPLRTIDELYGSMPELPDFVREDEDREF